MTITSYINNDVPILPIQTSIEKVIGIFNEITCCHIPVEKDGVFVGSLDEKDARGFDKDKKISDYQHALEVFFVREGDAWLGVLETFSRNKTNLVPVLNEENRYIGYVELEDVLSLFDKVPFLSEPGGILVVEKGFTDYSFSEITQIVESNQGKVLGAFISKIENEVAWITLKINSSGMNEIIQGFRRYGYNIISHHQEDTFKQNLKERSEYLSRYLNI